MSVSATSPFTSSVPPRPPPIKELVKTANLKLNQTDELLNSNNRRHRPSGVCQGRGRPHVASLNIGVILNSRRHDQTHRSNHTPSGTCHSNLISVSAQPQPVSFPVTESPELKLAFYVRSLANKSVFRLMI